MGNKVFPILALALILLFFGCTQQQPGANACAQDTKTCSNGSVVGRDPNNNCEFFACPQPGVPVGTEPPSPEPIACPQDAQLCSNGTEVGRDPENNCRFFACPELQVPNDFEITLSKGCAFGSCPAYTLAVKADGTVNYKGIFKVKVIGERTAQIEQEKVKQLYDKVVSLDFFNLPTPTPNYASDGSLNTMEVTLNGKTHITPTSDEFELEVLIKEVTNAKQWIE